MSEKLDIEVELTNKFNPALLRAMLDEQEFHKAEIELQLKQIRQLLYIVIALIWLGVLLIIWVS